MGGYCVNDHRLYGVLCESMSYKDRRNQNKVLLQTAKRNGCVLCGSFEDLQFHHIDEKTKVNDVSNMLHNKQKTLLAEINKYVVLCEDCHRDVHREKKWYKPVIEKTAQN